MEKLKLHSPDFIEQNIAWVAERYPNCVTEARDDDGILKRAIDFDQLRQELSASLVDGPRERYHLDWPGKREALLAANAPIAKTLRPCRKESVNFDTTKNLFIEGDNHDALKLFQETYLNKVKMIYIDPPYNTGNDFIYNDDFFEPSESYLNRSSQKDNIGNRLVANNESNGRFHSDWLSMMYGRLKLAKNILRNDGVIFISIDDNEESNLFKVCEEIFGADNFVAKIAWQRKYGASNNAKGVAPMIDYLLCFQKSSAFVPGLFPRSEEATDRYINPDNDSRGPWKAVDYWNPVSPQERPNLAYVITNPNTGLEITPTKKAWKYSREKYQEHESEHRIYWGKDGTNTVPTLKRFLSEVRDGVVPTNFWDWKFAGHTDGAKKEYEQLMEAGTFDTPKPTSLIKRMCQLAQIAGDDIVVDFFAGSATTAHAILNFNAEGGDRCRFVMVQLAEPCNEGTVAHSNGYRTIAELGKERIRRAGNALKKTNATTAPNLDIGFRVLKVDTSNMKDVYYMPDGVMQGDLLDQIENIREDRTPEDLLFQVLLDWGVDLSLPISQEEIEGKTVFFVDGNALAGCFDRDINEELVKKLAAHKPLRAVFRDAGFSSDSSKINVEQFFKLLSPSTELRSI
jgi:adenine-specific DNA-methyltransferase